ncbi:6500_t:CDS:2 [Entrophospora sp. SA101]|nr:6500_t:CDS:2 [Entrophospora sp. SA101]CAJ0923206.1 14701_t:CDS:2 [Entrophospora sp. SA101]
MVFNDSITKTISMPIAVTTTTPERTSLTKVTLELFTKIGEYLNHDLGIKSVDYVYDFLCKVKDVSRNNREHIINIINQTRDPVILQKLVKERCSYILRNWIKEEAKFPDSYLLFKLLKTVQHLSIDLEMSTSCGLGRVVNNKLVKESNIPGVAEIASDLLNRWLQDAKKMPESTAGNNILVPAKSSKSNDNGSVTTEIKKESTNSVVKGIFDDIFDLPSTSTTSPSSFMVDHQSLKNANTNIQTKTSNAAITTIITSSLLPSSSPVGGNQIETCEPSTLSKKRKRVSFAPDFMLAQVKYFGNERSDGIKDVTLSTIGSGCSSRDIEDVRDLDRRERKVALKRLRKTPYTRWYTPLFIRPRLTNKKKRKKIWDSNVIVDSLEAIIQKSREEETLEVIYPTVDQVPENPYESQDLLFAVSTSKKIEEPKKIPFDPDGPANDQLTQRRELKKAITNTYSMWFEAHPNEMPPIATVQQLPNPNTWSYEPNQNISDDFNVGLAAMPIPGRIDAASSKNNNNNQIIPNYYDSNASISTPDLVPPSHLQQQPLQPPTPYQSQPYQLPKFSQPNQPSFQFPYYDDNNNSASNVQPNYCPLPASPTQDPQDLNSKIFVSSQFQFSAQYQLPSATQPSKFINIANGRCDLVGTSNGRPVSGRGSECCETINQ